MFLVLAAVLAVAVLLAYLPALRARRHVVGRMLWVWATLCWGSGVLLITLVPRMWGFDPARTLSLIPFASFSGGLGLGGSVLIEVVANCLMFGIGGFLLGLATDKTGLIATICVGLALFVEACQYALALGRVASIDDVFWACIGSLVGAAVARRFKKARRRRQFAGTRIEAALGEQQG
ncbi:hypothetical protein GCM10008096_29270 [Zhihengliuella salsuginis]|uniref:VanZ-like domain-containing protein n=2 Tax=Zhihengliuella salsuginis TaxID=578222 RepID=A0ABQ3GMQ7_9MICC|nr:hypothetical protein GCM10008096_29270 [Zhihengliuella salsuginis]